MSKRPTKLLIATGIFPPSVGGPATYSKLLLDELPKQDIEVDVVTFDAVRKWPIGIRHIIFFFMLFRKAPSATHIYAQDPVSVGLPAVCVANIWRKRFWIRVAGDYAWEQGVQRFGVQDSIDVFQDKKYGRRVEWLRNVQRFVVRNAQKVIVPSDYFKELVGSWDKKINPTRIYNGIKLLEQLPDKNTVRDKLDLDKNKKIIISAGRMVPWKGFSELIEAFSIFRKKQDEVLLVILGDGPDKSRLLGQVEKLGLISDVRIPGSVSREEMFEYMRASDIFVLNAGFESFSFQTVEAMSVGLPVVVKSIGSLPELVTEKAGFLVNDITEMFEGVSKIFTDRALAESFSESARERSEVFSVEKTVSSLVKMIQHEN